MQHLIRKQIMHMQISSAESAYSLQQEASRYYHSTILPVLEKIFDALSSEEQVLTFDRVELDLGLLRQNNSEQFVSETELYPLIQKQFEKYFNDEHRTAISFYTPDDHSKKSKSFHAFDQWIHYMQYGVLPWNIRSVDDKTTEQVLEVLSTDEKAVSYLTERIHTEQVVSLRIARFHEEPFLVRLIEALTGEKQTTLPELISSVEELLKGGTNQKTKEELWELIVQRAIVKENTKTTQALLKQLCQYILPLKNQTDQQLLATSGKWPLLKSILVALTESTISETEIKAGKTNSINESRNGAASPKKTEHIKASDQKGSSDDSIVGLATKDITGNDRHADRPANEVTEDPLSASPADTKLKAQHEWPIASSSKAGAADNSKSPPTAIEERSLNSSVPDFQASANLLLEDGIFVRNAGLVLLHPFFQFLFRNTGLSKGREFTDRFAQQQAIYLLHYIATGETRADEHFLIIPKLICGWTITEPVIKDAALTETMLTEAADLIRAAIAQWTILKNTSAEGLRESFLQREGKVHTKADKIYIQVEKNSIDILLDHLPWNTSIIKFPWVRDILWVEWR